MSLSCVTGLPSIVTLPEIDAIEDASGFGGPLSQPLKLATAAHTSAALAKKFFTPETQKRLNKIMDKSLPAGRNAKQKTNSTKTGPAAWRCRRSQGRQIGRDN